MNDKLENVLPSLIILKNSIVSGAIPLPENLEIGEVALSLFKGEESIWVKNSSNEIINLRKPRYDLFWGDLLRSYETLDEFNNDLDNGNINENSIAYIKKEKLIWTGGVTYASSYSLEEIQSIIGEKLIFIPSKVFELNENSNSDQISEAFSGIDNYKSLVNKVITSDYVSSIKIEGKGSVPVSLISSISSNNYSLEIEWINSGIYIKKTILLQNAIFSINIVTKNLIEDLKTVENKIDQIYNFNKSLVTPIINGSWSFFNNSGEKVNFKEIDNINPVVEKGFKAQFTGTYKWIHEDDKKDPTSVSSNSSWSDLPLSNVNSKVITSDIVNVDTNIFIELMSPRTGLSVINEKDVVLSSGFDYEKSSTSIKFLHKLYYGAYNKGVDLVENDIFNLPNNLLVESREKTIYGINLEKNQFFIYAYPKELGYLTDVLQSSIMSILGAFNLVEMRITNQAGINLDMLVYISNNPGCLLDNTKLEFK